MAAEQKPEEPAFQFYDDDEIERLPSPTWLLEDLLMTERLALLFATPGIGKTFLVLAWAFSIVLGRPWLGRPTKQGLVVYVPGEGVGGLANRFRAWKVEADFKGRAGLKVAKRMLNLLSPRDKDVEGFIASLKELKPALVIVDTLARGMVGGDEDSAEDMGRAVAAMERIAGELSAAVLVLHHPVKKNAGTERGSGALRGAMDTVIHLRGTKESFTLKVEKQKDAEPAADIQLRLKVVPLDAETSSCVVEAADGRESRASKPLGEKEVRALQALAQEPNQQARYTAWQKVTGIKARTFDRVRDRLMNAGLVEQSADDEPYRLTTAGVTATAKPLPFDCHGNAARPTAQSTATIPSPLRGKVAVGSEGQERLGDALAYVSIPVVVTKRRRGIKS